MSISDWSSDVCSSDLKVKDNTFTAIVKTTTTTPCIRTDGPLSQFEISDNTIKNYGTGADLRTTIGAVDNGFVGIQFFKIGRASCRERVSVRVDLGGSRNFKKII